METQNNTPSANTAPSGHNPSPNMKVDDKTLMGIFSYLGPLVIVSYLVAKENPFVRFHIRQGAVLFVIEVALWILGMILPPLWMIIKLLNIAALIYAILGIVNVVRGLEKKLPLIGDYSRFIPL